MPTRIIHCPCGARIESQDDGTLAATIRAHNQSAHPKFDLNDAQMAKIVEATMRSAPWDGTTAVAENVEVVALTPDRAGAFLAFFDRDAFSDNPGWASCYCFFYNFPGSDAEWQARRSDENRGDKEASIRSGAARGYLAYADGAPAAWCNATPRTELAGLDRYPAFHTDDSDRVGAIVCFNVAPQFRRQGIAAKLLDAACDGFRAQGLAFAEAYPAKAANSDARAYHGPIQMYLNAGFEQIREDGNFAVVRKPL